MRSTLQGFVETADAIRSASGKLEKTRLLADFLRGLDHEDLYWAPIYFAGSAFARNTGKVLQIGFAQLHSAALAVTGASAEAFSEEYLKWSDVGDTLAVLYGDR